MINTRRTVTDANKDKKYVVKGLELFCAAPDDFISVVDPDTDKPT
jgi:hypothetical protein